jgi:hypothetical protein
VPGAHILREIETIPSEKEPLFGRFFVRISAMFSANRAHAAR